MNRSEFESNIIKKASADPAYRERLLAAPKAVISEELNSLKEGAGLPADVKVSVMQETPDQLYLVLPMTQPSTGGVKVSSMAAEAPSQAGNPVLLIVSTDVVSQFVYATIQETNLVVVD